MDKGLVFALLAPLGYALGNVVMEHRLSRYNALTLVIVYCCVILLCAVIVRSFTKTDDPSYDFPVGMGLVWMVVLGVVFFFADFSFVSAYTHKVNMMTITICAMLIPVFAQGIKFVGSLCISDMHYALPNRWHILSYILAAGAAFDITKAGIETNA